MRRALSFVIMVCLALAPGVANSRSIGHGLTLDLPPGWEIISDTLTFPVHIVNDEASTQFSVFRSEFAAVDAVNNQEDLKNSVQKVIDEVILALPHAKLLTSTGFNQTYRAGFVLEFVSEDTTAKVTLRHRFGGMLYRLPDNRQALFTLWAKAPVESFAVVDSTIRQIQASFEYRGPQEASVFPPRINPYIIVAILMLLAIGLLYYTKSRRLEKSRPNDESGHFRVEPSARHERSV